MTAIMTISTVQQLEEILYGSKRLAYSSHLTLPGTFMNVAKHSPVFETLFPFMVNFLGKGAPLSNEILDAYEKIFSFFPLTATIDNAINKMLEDMRFSQRGTSFKNITKNVFPIAYFLDKAKDMSGFHLLAIPARDFIYDFKEVVVPAVLAACDSIPQNLHPEELLPAHILNAPEIYRQRNKSKSELAESTRNDYRRVLKKFLPYVLDAYRVIGCGSSELFADSFTTIKDAERVEQDAEDRHLRKRYALSHRVLTLSDPAVLKPHILNNILTTEEEIKNAFKF